MTALNSAKDSKWSTAQTEFLINSRSFNHKKHFLDKRHGSGWQAVFWDFQKAGFGKDFSIIQMKKKWANLLFVYKNLKDQTWPYKEHIARYYKSCNEIETAAPVDCDIDYGKCRLCQKMDIEYFFSEKPDLCKMIASNTSIEVSEMMLDLPNGICYLCYSLIESFRNFVYFCKETDAKLKKCLLHKKPKISKCPTCPRLYDENLNNPCTYCMVSEEQQNINKDATAIKTIFYCQNCSENFIGVEDFYSHMSGHASTPMIEGENNNVDSEISSCDSFDTNFAREDGKYSCNAKNCNKSFKTLKILHLHKYRRHNLKLYLCHICGKTLFSELSLQDHEKTHFNKEAYKCNLCDRSFSALYNLNTHKRKHEGLRFCCAQCPKSFLSKCTLKRHVLTHSNTRNFQCSTCKKSFYTEKELVRHKKYHSGTKLHQCKQCSKLFYEKYHLKVHMRRHTGERPFQCEFENCKKAFVASNKLKRHMKIHCGNE